jgi:hypothetical protein
MTSSLLRWLYERPPRRSARLVAGRCAARGSHPGRPGTAVQSKPMGNRVGQSPIGDTHQTGSVFNRR